MFLLRLLLILDSRSSETISRVRTQCPGCLWSGSCSAPPRIPLPCKDRSVATPFGNVDSGLTLARPAVDGIRQRPIHQRHPIWITTATVLIMKES